MEIKIMQQTFKSTLSVNGLKGRIIYKLLLKEEEIKDWCIFLSSLRYKITRKLVLEGYNGEFIQITFDENVNKDISNRRAMFKQNNNSNCLILSLDELDYWIWFSLSMLYNLGSKYDHIDLDVDIGHMNIGYSQFYITVSVVE